MKRLTLILTALLLVASCAGGTKRNADHNAADIEFSQQMIPHHQQAIEMADLVPGANASPEIEALAVQIKAAQDPEIAQMKGWLEEWDANPMGGHDMDEAEMDDGMLDSAEMRELTRATGAEFDRLWLTGMIGHHEGAVEMAETVLTEGKDPATKKLARAVISGQQEEIATMKGLLG